ncbi:MAG: anaerobic ribonucleoside-triphosphate reductase activating protein [Spirochaetes bacterium]|nr:anaerobic ribonucleoside-triphosphate reductase activating protein [Spirochaetota bacterium]
MNIRGLYKTSLVDYPEKITSTIFLGGCNLRCSYCHNPDLALNSSVLEKIEENEVLDFLKKRKSLIDGVTISGGEPTIEKGLIPFLEKVKSLKLLIKIDTNGFLPHIISTCIEKELIDYAAVDIKTSPEKYPSLTGKNLSFDLILSTIDIIKSSKIDHEIRTTCVPGFVTVDDIKKIGESVGPVKKYYLQQFVNTNTLLNSEIEILTPYSIDYLHKLKDEAEKFSSFCSIRGI